MFETETTLKLNIGKFKTPCTFFRRGDRVKVSFPFNRGLINEIKMMKGARWHPEEKYWSIEYCTRNLFQIRYMLGENVYAKYDVKITDELISSKFKGRAAAKIHQKRLVTEALIRKYMIWAADMGTGKSLMAIELAEHVWAEFPNDTKIYYVGPRSGVKAFGLELIKWDSHLRNNVICFTYDALVDHMKKCPEGLRAPRVVILDESSKIKNASSQRSTASMWIAENVRAEHGENGYVVLLTGTPAPKDPTNWHHQTEVACPGFLREGDAGKLRKTLAITVQDQSLTGGVFPRHITWLDDPKKCSICGQVEEHFNHFVDSKLSSADAVNAVLRGKHVDVVQKMISTDIKEYITDVHAFTPSVNEVARLHKRMAGLVHVLFKRDVTDLPEKIYEIVRIKPTEEMVRSLSIVRATIQRVAQQIILAREISDGFLYKNVEDGEVCCPACHGKCTVTVKTLTEEQIASGIDPATGNVTYGGEEVVPCDYCSGTGVVPKMVRTTEWIKTPKDEALLDILDEYEECGRGVVWSGFSGTIDKLKLLLQKEGWSILMIDKRGYNGFTYDNRPLDSTELLTAMDLSHKNYSRLRDKYPKLAVVGNSQAGGMALTFTASPFAVYYSNPFDGEARMQSEDRIHRLGMDVNKGAKIIDLFCLYTDELVYKNIKTKKKLQDITLGDLSAYEREI